ncbi:MAG: diguanylate cyclase [Caldilineae bacterium]|nr:MAG: diguanylate cyclase [Caldilineae bacterium]
MELRMYLKILQKKWWIVLPVFLAAVTATVVLTFTQMPIYRTSTTLVVAPSPGFEDVRSFASGLNILSTRQEIASTYAEIATSRLMKNAAAEVLGLSREEKKQYTVESKVQAGTNIIVISVEGPDPVIASEMANHIANNLSRYAEDLYETFILRSLDEATVPVFPVRPNKVLNIGLATVLGLVLGVGFAFLSEYLQTPVTAEVSLNFLDPETGVYNREYFSRRLGEEMARAKRNRYPLSVALMRIEDLPFLRGPQAPRIRSEILRQISVLTNEYLRSEDVVARYNEDTFAFLLPDVSGENARAIMEYLQTRIAWTPFESSLSGLKFNLRGSVGVVSYNHNGTGRDELLAKAFDALQMAEVNENGKIHLAEENASTHV